MAHTRTPGPTRNSIGSGRAATDVRSASSGGARAPLNVRGRPSLRQLLRSGVNTPRRATPGGATLSVTLSATVRRHLRLLRRSQAAFILSLWACFCLAVSLRRPTFLAALPFVRGV